MAIHTWKSRIEGGAACPALRRKPWNGMSPHGIVQAHQRQAMLQRLRDEQAVERIAVQRRQIRQVQERRFLHGQTGDFVRDALLGKIRGRWSGQGKFPSELLMTASHTEAALSNTSLAGP